MTGEEIALIIEQFAEALGMASSEIIPHYALWYKVSSMSYIMFGVFMILFGASIYISKKKFSYDSDENYDWVFFIIALVLTFMGALIIFTRLDDFFGATGIAIHRLILDLRCN